MSNWSNAGRVRPVSKGTWSSTVAYTVLDLVTSSDKLRSYIATQNVPAGTPLTNTAYWQVLVDATTINDTANSLMDRLASPFDKSGSVVTCHPVEGYSLKTKTLVEPVQAGSGDPSPSNVRPISGHTGAKLTKCGKNLLNVPSAININSTTSIADRVYQISCKLPAGTYTVSLSGYKPDNNGTQHLTFYYMGLDGNEVYPGASINQHNTHYSFTFTAWTGIEWCAVYVNVADDTYTVNNLMLELGSTATAYEPYQGETFTANFGQTVYGGTLDWNAGVLTVDRAGVTLNGTENYVRFGDTVNYPHLFVIADEFSLVGVQLPHENNVSSHYRSHRDKFDESCFYLEQSGVRPYINDIRFTKTDELKTFIEAQYAAGTPVQICYKLANPITIQLTPAQILALKGTNSLYSDCGDTAVFGRIDPEWMNEQFRNAIIALGGNV